MELDNITIGKNIARFRRVKDIKAVEIAEKLGLKEAAYTKYERGETAITIDFIRKVADVLEVNPLSILSASPGNFLESITNSSIAIQENSTFQTTNHQQTELVIKLMENVVMLNERLVTLLEKK